MIKNDNFLAVPQSVHCNMLYVAQHGDELTINNRIIFFSMLPAQIMEKIQ